MGYFCSVCKSDITDAEFNYSMDRYGKALCRQHQKEFVKSREPDNFRTEVSKTETTVSSIPDSEKEQNFSSRDSKFVENMIKGRIAETLIEELFLSLNYSVFRYGMENTVPGIMKLLRGVRSDVATNIRRMPDFVIQNNKNGEVFFIEVKFRKDEVFAFENLDKDYPYENCYFIVVSKKHIKCVTYEELRAGDAVTPNSRNYLGNRKEFELDKEVIIQFCDFAVKFFSVV
ncbi:hypothetical protein MSSIH_2028 [Methanosarcina siciliae HI350]|uniref:Uncharacterized protein n=1 Tax=Methanosarcina siciliae HI350 TaxID=1434119 RepID=A0A0E3PDT6_9EURY|nr:hypothetical protein [Methanosarcina siciliae]AKB32718.1 hypothetical protein MSSIH_2028 [Methanosarcina siciliae HI350]